MHLQQFARVILMLTRNFSQITPLDLRIVSRRSPINDMMNLLVLAIECGRLRGWLLQAEPVKLLVIQRKGGLK